LIAADADLVEAFGHGPVEGFAAEPDEVDGHGVGLERRFDVGA
jgi:hypothetical protein